MLVKGLKLRECHKYLFQFCATSATKYLFKKKHFLENSKRCLLPIQSCLLSELLRMEIEEIYSTAGNRHKNTILDIQSSKLTFFLICKTSSAGSCKWESLKKIFHILHVVWNTSRQITSISEPTQRTVSCQLGLSPIYCKYWRLEITLSVEEQGLFWKNKRKKLKITKNWKKIYLAVSHSLSVLVLGLIICCVWDLMAALLPPPFIKTTAILHLWDLPRDDV